jgi:RNA polymerase sigma factor (TIGR02999 family)
VNEVTQILSAIAQGDPSAASQLLPLVYDQLRALAAHKLAHEQPGQTLQPTALVHEAYLRLVGTDSQPEEWQGRQPFFAAAAEAMRRILVENARRKHRQKRGGGRAPQALEPDQVAAPEVSEDLLALDEALTRLAHVNPRAARLVHLRYFGGLTIQQAAEVLDISSRTADADWAYARAWLLAAIGGEDV